MTRYCCLPDHKVGSAHSGPPLLWHEAASILASRPHLLPNCLLPPWAPVASLACIRLACGIHFSPGSLSCAEEYFTLAPGRQSALCWVPLDSEDPAAKDCAPVPPGGHKRQGSPFLISKPGKQ